MATNKLIRSSYVLTIVSFFSLNLFPPLTFPFAFCVLSLPLYLTLSNPERYSVGVPGWMSDATSLENLIRFNGFVVLGYIAQFSISGTLWLWVVGIVVTNLIVLFLWVFFLPVRRYKSEYRFSVFMLVIFALYAVGDLGLRYYSTYETAIVADKRDSFVQVKGAAVPNYVVEVAPGGPLSKINEVKVNSAEYEELHEGQTICLRGFSSWIHRSWVRLHTTEECSVRNPS